MNRCLNGAVTALVLLALAAGSGCKSYAYSKSASVADAVDSSGLVAGAPAEAAGVDRPAETAGVEQTTNATDRLMTYDATLSLVVRDVATALEALRAQAATLKGYMQSMTQDSIVLRIPAARLQEAIHQAEALGDVTAREIVGTDVTEEMLDLDIRLRNLQEMRDHLVKLLDKGDKVEDLLKVEKELERVTGELEQLKGRIKFLSHAIAYSTLTLHLNSPLAPRELQEAIPFPWVRNLAETVVLRPSASFVPETHWWSWLHLDLPQGYVRLHESDGCLRAMSGSGVMVLIQREPNFEGGTAEFWEPIVKRSLTAGKTIAVTGSEPFTLATGARGFTVDGTRTIGNKAFAYRVSVIVGRKAIHTFECWGPADAVARDRDALDETRKGLRIKP